MRREIILVPDFIRQEETLKQRIGTCPPETALVEVTDPSTNELVEVFLPKPKLLIVEVEPV